MRVPGRAHAARSGSTPPGSPGSAEPALRSRPVRVTIPDAEEKPASRLWRKQGTHRLSQEDDLSYSFSCTGLLIYLFSYYIIDFQGYRRVVPNFRERGRFS